MAKMTVEDTSLTAVADAIRTKGGTTDALVFPDGFVSAIDGMSGGENYLIEVIEGDATTITAEMLYGCTKLRNNAFAGYSALTNIELPSTLVSIGNNAFQSCSALVSVMIPEGVTSIGNYAYQSCYGITSVTLPSTLVSIGNNAFQNSWKFLSITIPENVTSIGNNAFNGCGIKTYQMKPTVPPTLGTSALDNRVEIITVPRGTLEAYQSATNWSAYADKMVEATE